MGGTLDGYLRFYRAELSSAVTESAFARLRDGEEGMLGARRPTRPAGPSGSPSWYPIDDLEHGGLTATWRIYVGPEGRAAGARALFDAVYAAARERGVNASTGNAAVNAPARSLYDVVGRLYVVRRLRARARRLSATDSGAARDAGRVA